MATAEEGGATATSTATATNSSYGGGAGVGGKFRKRPFRRQTTPYDRPPTALRANNNSNANWLTKLVVDPAFRLISYGANRFLGSIRRGSLPPPPLPHQASEVNHDVGGGFQEAVSNELTVRKSSLPINSSDINGISDLEQLLKQNTFTRSEINRLTDLLHSKAAESSLVDERERKGTPSGPDRHVKFAGGHSDENTNKGIRSHGTTSTPLYYPKVLEDDIGSPAELAKAYMGSRPSKVSPSMLGMHSHGGREDTVLFGNTPFNSKSPIVPFTRKSLVSQGAVENGFITPRSRGRSPIYSMARTPYSRGHSTSIVKGVGNNNNDFGQSMPSSSRSISAHGGQLESKSMTLKRRSSYLDDEVGSIGPIRRIRQKQNLLAPRVSHTVHGSGIGSAKLKQPLIGEANHDRLKAVVENENGSVPSTSYTPVPSKSREVASRILQHLEKLSPKEKSSDKSPFKLTPGMLRGQALRSMDLRSMEDVGTSKFMQDVRDDRKMEDRSNGNLSDERESTSEKQEKGSKDSVAPLELWSSAKKNESVAPLKDPGPSSSVFDSVVRNGASQPPQKKRSFWMSAHEDSFDQDDDVHDNGIAPTPLLEKKGSTEVPLVESNLPTAEEPKLVKTTVQPEEVKSTSGEFGCPSSGKAGESSGALALPDSEEASKASQSSVLPPPATAFDKPKDNPPPLFSFSSNVGDKFPPLPSESSTKKPEPILDGSSSFINTSAPNGPQLKTPEPNNGDLNPPKSANKIEKPDTAPPASNGPVASNPTPFSFNIASSNDKNQITTTGGTTTCAAPSTSITSFTSTGTATGTSTSATSTGSIFGPIVTPSTSKGPIFSFTAATYPSTSVSTASTTVRSESTDSKTKADTNQIFGSGSNSTYPPFSSASSGTSIFGGLTSSATNSTPINPQTSPFNNATVPQGSSAQAVSSTTFSSFNTNTTTPFGSSFSISQPFNSNPTSPFGNSSASSSDSNPPIPVSGPTPTVEKFGSTTSTNTIGSGSAATSSPSIFGGSSSSTSTNTIGSSSAATSSPFIFGGSSSSTSTITIGSSSAASSSPFIFGGSSSSTPTNTIGSSSAATSSPFIFSGSSSASTNTIGSSAAATSSPFIFGGSSFASSSAPMNSTTAPSNVFGSSIFGSLTPSTGFLFGAASTTPSTPTNTTPSVFTSSTSTSSSPIFPFSAQSAPSLQTPSQPVFGAPNSGFGASPVNNYQMNAEDSMAEDPVQSTSVFGLPAVSPSPSGFMFGQPPPAQVNPFQFGGQQSQVSPVNLNPFQASGSLEFNATGSFSLGTGGGGDKSGRRIVKVTKNRNRKK